MKLTIEERKKIVGIAMSHLGRGREEGFRCVDFVREVFRSIDIEIPPLSSGFPPKEFNIAKEDLVNLPLGEIIFFRNLKDQRGRKWTHVAIAVSSDECIHCSYFFGEKVVVSNINDMLARYEFVESAAQ